MADSPELAERLAKLPVWAQRYIKAMRRSLERAEGAAEEARLATNPAGSDTVLHSPLNEPVGLGVGSRIRFRRNPRASDYIEVRNLGDGRIEVLGCGGSLNVRPVSGNVIIAGVTRR